eukprot:s2561_g6.t1
MESSSVRAAVGPAWTAMGRSMEGVKDMRTQVLPPLPEVLTNLEKLPEFFEDPDPVQHSDVFPSFSGLKPLMLRRRGDASVPVAAAPQRFLDRPRSLRVGVILAGEQSCLPSYPTNVVAGLYRGLKALSPGARLVGFVNGPRGFLEGKFKEITENQVKKDMNQGSWRLLGHGSCRDGSYSKENRMEEAQVAAEVSMRLWQTQDGDLAILLGRAMAGKGNQQPGSMTVDQQGSPAPKRKVPDPENLALSIDMIREAIRGELKDAMTDLKQEMLECLEKGGGAASSTAGSTVAPGKTQRKPALIMGGWDPGQEAAATKEAATDILRSVEAPIPTDGLFVPGVRRGYAILPIDDRVGESFEQRRQRVQEVISKVRGANLHLGQRPDGTPRTAELYLTAGGDIGALQMEFSTGTAWVHNAKICSATAPRPGGTEEAGPGWVDITAIAAATKSTKEAIDALWSPLKAEII